MNHIEMNMNMEKSLKILANQRQKLLKAVTELFEKNPQILSNKEIQEELFKMKDSEVQLYRKYRNNQIIY